MGRETSSPPAAAPVGSETDLLVRNGQVSSVERESELQLTSTAFTAFSLCLGLWYVLYRAGSPPNLFFTTWRECRKLKTSKGANTNSVDFPTAIQFITVDSRLRGLVG